MKAVILNFPLKTFFHNVFEEVKKKQNDIQLRKINFLYKEAYKYFVEIHITKSANEKKVDFPPFVYECGMVICEEAATQAEQIMLKIIQDGRVNECYTERIKQLRKQQRGF